MPKWTYMSVPSHFGNFIFCRFLWQIVCLFFILSCPSYPVSVDLRVFRIIAISIIWRAASWGAACRRRHLSALQTMEMLLDGAKYDWLLNLQTLILPWERKTLYRKSRNLGDEIPKMKLPRYICRALDTKQKLYNFSRSNVSFFYLLTLSYMIDSRLLAEWIWIKYIYILS